MAAEIKLYTELREQCLTKLNISNIEDQTLTNLACMDNCILEKVGIITAEGVFNTENIPLNIRLVAISCNEETQHLEKCLRAQTYNLCVFKAVGIKVLAEVCANETNTVINIEAMPRNMMNFTNSDLNCYNRCMLIKMEKIDANNNINASLLKIYVEDSHKVEENVKFCERENRQEDKCEQTVQREMCIMDKFGIM